MRIYKEVKCSDRLPNDNKKHFIIYDDVDRDAAYYDKKEDYWQDSDGQIIEEADYWLEPIEVELDSEKILPKEERINNAYEDLSSNADFCGIINVLNKALEAAELKVIELQSKVDAYLKIKEAQKERVIFWHNRSKQFEQDADERYNKAINNIVWNNIPKEIDKEQLKTNLKIAAYGNNTNK